MKVSLANSTGDDPAAFVSCYGCLFVERAALIVDISARMVSNKKKAVAENAVYRRKTDAVSTAS